MRRYISIILLVLGFVNSDLQAADIWHRLFFPAMFVLSFVSLLGYMIAIAILGSYYGFANTDLMADSTLHAVFMPILGVTGLLFSIAVVLRVLTKGDKGVDLHIDNNMPWY